MNNGHRAITALLAVIAVLLGLNLWPRGEAEAGQRGVSQGPCCLPDGTCEEDTTQEMCDIWGCVWYSSPARCLNIPCVDSLTPPTLVDTEFGVTTTCGWVLRSWSDGSADWTYFDRPGEGDPCATIITCGPVPILDAYCRADVTRSGEVDVVDFLEVIGNWGPCD